MELLFFLLLLSIVILLIWNILFSFRNSDSDRKFHELSARLNYVTATGAVFLAVASYLGYTNEKSLNDKNEEKITKFIDQKSGKIDSIINSKDILKAGVYIVNDLEFVENKKYFFEELQTINHKLLPKFALPPKLIINTNTGENLRIVTVTETYFVLGAPITRHASLLSDEDNKYYPRKLKFDVWIADYKDK